MNEDIVLIAKNNGKCIWLKKDKFGVYVMKGGCSRFSEETVIAFLKGVSIDKIRDIFEYCVQFWREMEKESEEKVEI